MLNYSKIWLRAVEAVGNWQNYFSRIYSIPLILQVFMLLKFRVFSIMASIIKGLFSYEKLKP